MTKAQSYLNILFWLAATCILSPIFFSRITFKKKKSMPSKILVVSPARVGDLVCITPVFREIKKKFPFSQLTVLSSADSRDLLANNPHIGEIMSVDDYVSLREKFKLIAKLKKAGYDWAVTTSPINIFIDVMPFWALIPQRILLTYRALGEAHRLAGCFSNYRLEYHSRTSAPKHFLNMLKFMNIEKWSEAREIFTSPAGNKKAADFLQTNHLGESDLLIGMSVTAGVKLLEWMPENWAKLADMLVSRLQAKIIFTGAPGDEMAVRHIQDMMREKSCSSAGQFRLDELPALMTKMKLFISVESGAIFIADALGVPTVVMIGPSDIDMKEQPLIGSRRKTLQKDLPCRPCSLIFLGERACKQGHVKCVRDISVDEVFGAAADLLSNAS